MIVIGSGMCVCLRGRYSVLSMLQGVVCGDCVCLRGRYSVLSML